jgi:hypothetical protein
MCLICPCCHVRLATTKEVEVVPSRSAAVLLPLALLPSLTSSRPRVNDHRVTARMASRSWWRVLVGGRMSGVLQIDRDGGVGACEKSMSANRRSEPVTSKGAALAC